MRVVDVVRVTGSGDGRTWRIILSCGHEVTFVSRARIPNRGMPRRRIEPCYQCLAARISR
jgi:hypothetical protein